MPEESKIFSIQYFTTKLQDFGKIIGGACISAKNYITRPESIERLNQCAKKTKQFAIEHKEILIGASVIGAIYWIMKNKQKQANSQLKKSRKPKNYVKLNNIKSFISQDEQISQMSKDEHNESTSTRRTESISDIEPKKKRKKNLEPIIDLDQEDDETQDRVFFEVYKTYMHS